MGTVVDLGPCTVIPSEFSPRGDFYFCGKRSPSPSPSPRGNSKVGGDLKKKKRREKSTGDFSKSTRKRLDFFHLFLISVKQHQSQQPTQQQQKVDNCRKKYCRFFHVPPGEGRFFSRKKIHSWLTQRFYAHFGQIWGRGGELRKGGRTHRILR